MIYELSVAVLATSSMNKYKKAGDEIDFDVFSSSSCHFPTNLSFSGLLHILNFKYYADNSLTIKVFGGIIALYQFMD